MLLYYSKGACSLAVRIMMHEMGITAEYESVNLQTKVTETGKDFRAINPKGEVPTLVLDSGEILTENAVILQYLVQLTHSMEFLPPVGDLNHYRVLEWLNFVSTDLHKGCGPLFNSQVPEALKESVFRPALKSKLAFVDKHLANHTYLMGDQFTLPDAYLFIILRWLHHLKIEMTEWPSLSRYFAALKNRKSVQDSLKEEQIGT